MLKKILRKLLSSSRHKHYGPHYGGYKKFSSSDHYHRPKYGRPPRHDQYGHGYYKKKGYYSSYSS